LLLHLRQQAPHCCIGPLKKAVPLTTPSCSLKLHEEWLCGFAANHESPASLASFFGTAILRPSKLAPPHQS
jgi:hypothetical protein